jgi:Tol biopolymer transport system component
MALTNGTRVGPYEITGWLGAGGMGEVYRARDPRLGRDVAIKLIPEALASDPARRDRFAQEARAAGQLNHPGILSVYDVGMQGEAAYVVSELLEGEPLRSLLSRGALPLPKAIDYARQVADALAAAHDKGIVHRDLKPDNLFVIGEGRIKILDFGLAKLTQPSSGITPMADTEPGVVLGTAGYLSPEQARGESVDHRSDIFSFGAIVFEMLTGRPAFTRATAAETTAAILKEDPAASLPPGGMPALERVLRRCLEKAREARFQSARDLSFALQEVASATSDNRNQYPAATAAPGRGWRQWAWLPAGAWVPAAPPPSAMRLSVELGAGLPLAPVNLQFGEAVVLSPDGTTLAFVAQDGPDDRARIYVRRLEQIDAVPLAGTEGAVIPFFSPDGQWLAFFAGGQLRKIPVTGGGAVSLARAENQRGGWWTDDGMIAFAPDRTAGSRLMRVAADGGEPEELLPAGGEPMQLWPQVLPGGKVVLYTGAETQGSYNDADLVVRPLSGGAPKVVLRGGYHGRYLASGLAAPQHRGGHLVYIHDGTLFAVPFDLDRLEVNGTPVPVLQNVGANSITGGAQFSVSNAGLLAYVPGRTVGGATPLQWLDRAGVATATAVPPQNWFNLSIAPDGRRIAMEVRDAAFDIWVHDLERGTLARMTADPAQDSRPVWTPDSRRIAFGSMRENSKVNNLFWQPADGSGAATRLTTSANAQQPGSWHPSGKFLLFEEAHPETGLDLMVLPMSGDDQRGWTPGTARAVSNERGRQWDPAFSPDGRWFAYSSDESGRAEIYVRPFPGPGGKWQASTGQGTVPTWSRVKAELLYGNDGEIMVVPFTVQGETFQTGKPLPWSPGRYAFRGPNRMFDLHPDGTRVAYAPASRTPNVAPPGTVVLIFNFFQELRRLAPLP